MSYAITGIPMPAQPDPQHPIPLRKEVTAWATDPENAVQFSLFIQALIKFQQMDTSDKLSYYQVAGIHGQPATSWDGANAPGQWYCNHQRTTFPTWHRPYLLLFEQRIYEIMVSEIVSQVTPASEQSIWSIEASHWRLPYWDWAADQSYLQNVGVPQLFTLPQVTVVMPNSKSATFNNPLWKFSNPKGIAMGDQRMGSEAITVQPFNLAVSTSRHAPFNNNAQVRNTFIQGVNNFNGANSSLQAHSWDQNITQGQNNYSIADLVSRLLTDNYLKTWRYFSSTLHQGEGGAPAPTEFLSLEEIHNNIHSFTGGDNNTVGHMQTPSVASFDPIFFLHHCNVDKQLAMWQTLNPTKWFDGLSRGDSGPTVALTPFHKDTKGTFYNSNDCQDWTKLNYQYDDLENTPRFIRAQTQGQVRGDHIAGHVRRKVNMHLNKSRQSVLSAPQLDGKDNDYLVNVVYDRYGLGGSPYSIHFFIGQVPDPLPEGTTTYATLDGYFGTIYTFSSTLELEGQGCENCIEQRKAGLLSKAQLVLTTKLIDDVQNTDRDIENLTPNAVSRYLNKQLTWKIVEAMTGRVVPHEELPRTKVYVLSGKAHHFEDPQQDSQYGDYSHLWDATQGKAGGASETDQGTHMEL